MAAKRPPNRTETLPSGVVVDYYDEVGVDGLPQKRRYLVNGEKLPSISTIAGSFDKPALMPAAVKLQETGVIELAKRGIPIAELTQPELRDEMRAAGLHYDSVWGQARRNGDLAHDMLLKLVGHDEVPNLADYDAGVRGPIAAGMKFALEHQPEPLAVEYMVASTEHGFAGRGDLCAQIGGRVIRVDYKVVSEWKYDKRSGELLPPYDENLIALAGYEIGAVESDYIASDARWIVRLGPDGEYDIYESTAPPELFLAALRAYTLKGHIGRPVAEAVVA